jgi:hypothetical protein
MLRKAFGGPLRAAFYAAPVIFGFAFVSSCAVTPIDTPGDEGTGGTAGSGGMGATAGAPSGGTAGAGYGGGPTTPVLN